MLYNRLNHFNQHEIMDYVHAITKYLHDEIFNPPTAKALSTVASTASFDKNPQSKERGITLDLGFSSFTVPFPAHLSKSDSSANPESGSNSDESGSSVCGSRYESVQFTLVDCPGHASLIRTIIGGNMYIIWSPHTWQSRLQGYPQLEGKGGWK